MGGGEGVSGRGRKAKERGCGDDKGRIIGWSVEKVRARPEGGESKGAGGG